MKINLKIYNPIWGVNVAQDWGLDAQEVDLATALEQPFRIACVPACFNDPMNFNFPLFRQSRMSIDLSQFDLVIISDIEQERYSKILQWIEGSGIKKYVLAIGATHNADIEFNAADTVLRSWWMYNLMRLNSTNDHMQPTKPFWFDVLLGARRPHRDFVMLNLQKHQPLLDKCIVTYRDGFTGGIVDDQTTNIHNYFPDYTLDWPHVSKNLDHTWEVKDIIEKSISAYVPWEIYQRTWYTAICETGFTGDSFFLTEKTTKVLYAKRVFVMFAPCQFLKSLRELGFKTFGSIIDESYDDELVDLTRYQMAWAQMLSLTQQDPVEVYAKVADILEHNKQRLTELEKETTGQMYQLLVQNIPEQYILNK